MKPPLHNKITDPFYYGPMYNELYHKLLGRLTWVNLHTQLNLNQQLLPSVNDYLYAQLWSKLKTDLHQITVESFPSQIREAKP